MAAERATTSLSAELSVTKEGYYLALGGTECDKGGAMDLLLIATLLINNGEKRSPWRI